MLCMLTLFLNAMLIGVSCMQYAVYAVVYDVALYSVCNVFLLSISCLLSSVCCLLYVVYAQVLWCMIYSVYQLLFNVK